MFNGVVIITGGSSGIGLALAEHLLQQGASVAICGRSVARLQAALEDLEAYTDRLLAVQAERRKMKRKEPQSWVYGTRRGHSVPARTSPGHKA